jgi:hypothetical protein
VSQRAVDEDAYAVLLAVGEYLLIDVPPEKVVGRLQAIYLAGLLELGHLVRVEVRDADVPDLALLHQLVQHTRRLLEGGVRVGPVDLVEVYLVGAQETQGVLDAPPEPVGARVPKHLTSFHPQAALGRQDYLFSTVLYLGL